MNAYIHVNRENPDTQHLGSFCPASHCLGVSTTALADAWLSVDHQASLWCNQVIFSSKLVRSREERRCSTLGPTQSRVSPSML